MIRPAQFWTLVALIALAVMSFGASLLAGSVNLPLGKALSALAGGGDGLTLTIVRAIRLPRSISAFSVGSLLALSGVLLQALFRNPLADPYVLGVSGGAVVGMLGGMLLGMGLGNLHWSATLGALLVGALVMWFGRGTETNRLLLSGVVMASATGALATVMLTVADNGQLRGMVFWLAGDLGWALRPGVDLSIAAAALIAALIFGRALNVLSAGELRSATLGLDARVAQPLVFVAAAILTSVAVLAAGPVGFIGLIAPHLVRLALRSADHRLVAPAAALCGGALLCLADVASRTLAAPRQLPVGAITGLLGAPVFLLLLRRRAPR